MGVSSSRGTLKVVSLGFPLEQTPKQGTEPQNDASMWFGIGFKQLKSPICPRRMVAQPKGLRAKGLETYAIKCVDKMCRATILPHPCFRFEVENEGILDPAMWLI